MGKLFLSSPPHCGRWVRSGLAAAVLSLASLAAVASAAPGQLDTSFGIRGIGGGELGPHYARTQFTAVSVAADGSLLATRDGLIGRYLPNGTLDPGFAPQKEPEPKYRVEAQQADGKLLAADGFEGKIRRLNPDGTSDTSFHGGESESTRIYLVSQIEQLPSGKILVAGRRIFESNAKRIIEQIALARINPDGTIDQGFGSNGLVSLRADLGVEFPYLQGVVVDTDDDGVLVVSNEALVKLTPDGRPDPGYGSGGIARLDKTSLTGFQALPGGGIALAGTRCCTSGGADSFFVARYGPDGRPDPSFAGGRGIATATFGERDAVFANAVLWETDGSILLGGAVRERSTACQEVSLCVGTPVLVRFSAEGGLDPGFGAGGVLRLGALAGTDSWFGIGRGVQVIAARPGGGAIAAGSGGTEESVAFLAGLGPDGALDSGFGSDGIVAERRPEPSSQVARAVAPAPGGKILVAAVTNAGPGNSAAIVRYTSQGGIDHSYGDRSGFAVAARTGGTVALAVDRTGAAFLLSREGVVSRIDPSGTLDRHFLQQRLPLAEPPTPEFRAVAVQRDGKVLIAGTRNWLGRSQMLVARLLRDGRLDRSFGRGGFAHVGCRRRGQCEAARITIPADGRILLAGFATTSRPTAAKEPSRLALACLLPSGAPDPDFGRDGFLTERIGLHSEATALALAGDRILVAGWVGSPDGPRSLLARYRLDGRRDRGFGKAGIAFGRTGRPTAVLPTPRRIVVVTKGTPRATFAYRQDGSIDRSYVSLRIGVGPAKFKAGAQAALQGGRAIVAWSARDEADVPSRSMIKLARLANR